MEHSVEYYRDMLKAIRFPKVKFRKFKYMEKPPRWVVVGIAVLLEIILMFIILWLFDDRTVFDNDYTSKRYSGEYIKWGWVHMGTTITLVLAAIIWFFVILIGEFGAYEEESRIFYNLYR